MCYLVDCSANPRNFRASPSPTVSLPPCLVYFPLHNLQLRNCEAEKLRNSFPLLLGASMNLIGPRATPNSTRFARVMSTLAVLKMQGPDLYNGDNKSVREREREREKDSRARIMTCTLLGLWFFALHYKGRIPREWILWTPLLSSAQEGKRRIFRLRNINPLVSFVRIPETFMR